jgi:lipid-A-disaccharide synthase
VLSAARFCLVASGTATLETALFNVPLLLMYKTSSFNYWLARYFIKIRQIGIVNILAGRTIIPEYIQDDASADRLIPHSLELIGDTPARAAMLEEFKDVKKILGDAGASERAAKEVLAVLRDAHNE